MGKNTDKDLILALKKGDIESFDKLFNIYAKRLMGFAFGLLKSEKDAEDIVQEVFIKIWENRFDLKEELSFKSYLFTTARNLIISSFRKKTIRNQYVQDYLVTAIESGSDTERLLEFNELNEIVNGAIEKLPAKRKELFILSRVEGLSNSEIAEKLNISVNTVNNQISSAIKSIRKELERFSLAALFFLALFFNA